MLDLAKNILDVVKSLLGLSDQLKAAERQRREGMAMLFESIGSCLADTSGQIRAGGIPRGRCGELIGYAEMLPGVIDREVGRGRAGQLGRTLHSAYGVERLALAIREIPDREPYLAQLEEAAGKFLALANVVRFGP